MKLSIITINRNNASGLEKTMASVLRQTCTAWEYIVVDGASTDESVDTIKRLSGEFGGHLKWISEPDKGIYNAMNKGIGMAEGDYVQFLNSGDCLVADDVVERMYKALEVSGNPPILYGNMLKELVNGKRIRDKGLAGQDITFLAFYTGTLNHSSAYIKKALFDEYGLYDESLKIVSDWKWFFQTIVLGDETPVYTDTNVTLFDMTGVSETNKDLTRKERGEVLDALVPKRILADYKQWSFSIAQMKRLKRHPWAYKLVWFLERCLFKIEKNKR